MILEYELEQAGQKPGKDERRIQAAQEAVMKKVFDPKGERDQGTGFADPALMFG